MDSVSYCVSCDWSMVLKGCLPFAKCFRKIRLECKWNKTLWVVIAENFRKQPNIWRGSSVFPDGVPYKRKFEFHLFKAIFDSSFRPSWSFVGKWN